MSYSKDDFFEFCRKGKLDKVKECVIQNIKPNIERNFPIQLASMFGHLEVVKYLASLYSVDPGENNNKAIIVATMNGHLEVVKYLASLDSVDPGADNSKPIICASRKGHLEVVKYLASLDSVDPCVYDNYPIRIASGYHNLEMIKYFVSIGAYRKGLSKKIDRCVIERQILIILCLNRKLTYTFEEETYKLFMKSD